jgi:hypothetical protein
LAVKWRIKASAFLAAVVVISTASYAQFNQALMLSIRGARVDGVCGSANGASTATAPTANLCSAGIASSVTGSGPWNWTCNGTNGGTNASCSAPLTGSGAAPQPAQAAGFTNHLRATDFSDAGHANYNQWLKCRDGTGFNGANPEWYQGWITLGDGVPCNASPNPFQQVTDGGNGKVLQMQWVDSYHGLNNINGTLFQGMDQDSIAGGIGLTFFYMEMVYRLNTVGISGNSTRSNDFWGTGACGASSSSTWIAGCIEHDMVEFWNNNGASFVVHNWDQGGGCGGGEACTTIWQANGNQPSFFSSDWTNYHKVAVRVTGNGTDTVNICGYSEDVPGVSGLQSRGCTGIPGGGTGSQLDGSRMGTTPQFYVAEAFGCSGSCAVGQPFIAYIKSIDIWVCTGYQPNQVSGNSTTRCATSNPNP